MLRIGVPYYEFESLPSTNNYVADQLKDTKLAEGAAILACQQTEGKGQRGRSWSSNKNLDLAVSYVLYPRLRGNEAFVFNKIIALSVHDCIRHFTDKEVKIKWPNDILIDDRKVAGILIELSWSGEDCKHAIVGVGINVGSQLDQLPDSSDTLIRHSDSVTVKKVFDVLNECLSRRYDQLVNREDDSIEKSYAERLWKLDVQSEFNNTGEVFLARMKGVDNQGRLILDKQGIIEVYEHGEISMPNVTD